jgi:hypothetical protein
MLKGHSLQVLHGNKTSAIALADFVDSANVGMVKRRCRSCFPAETIECGSVFSNGVGEEFQRDESAKRKVFGLIDNAHAATAEFLDDAIVRDGLANHGR